MVNFCYFVNTVILIPLIRFMSILFLGNLIASKRAKTIVEIHANEVKDQI